MKKNNFKVQKLADFGSSEPWVARIWMSFKEFIPRLNLEKVEKDKINDSFNDLFESLSLAFISLREIKENSKHPNIPLLSLKRVYFDFYDKLWTAYKDRFQKAIKELGYDIGFLFMNDQSFNDGLKKFFEEYTDLPRDFKKIIIEDRLNWQNKLSVLRNKYLQHKSITDDIENEFFTVECVEIYFHNVWTLIEDITIELMALKLPNILCFQEIEDSKRDVKCPQRYVVKINPAFQ